MNKLLLILLFFTGCTSPVTQMEVLQKQFPKYVISPSTSLLAGQGYPYMMEDTIGNQIYVVSFYIFSNKVSNIRNIK
jgi:hypothetical protein